MVTEETVEASWQEIGALSPERAHRHMMQLGRRQPELLAFVTAMAGNLSEAGQETVIYAFVVICHMFETSSQNRSRGRNADRSWQHTRRSASNSAG
jgi:hypothetical protein